MIYTAKAHKTLLLKVHFYVQYTEKSTWFSVNLIKKTVLLFQKIFIMLTTLHVKPTTSESDLLVTL